MLRRRGSSWLRDEGPLSRPLFALSLATFIAWTGAARANTAVILRPPNPSADVKRALTLVREELLPLGLDVAVSDRATSRGTGEPDSVAWLEPFAKQGVSAVIEAIGGGSWAAVEFTSGSEGHCR